MCEINIDILCRVIYFLEEHVSNQINRNSFAGFYLHELLTFQMIWCIFFFFFFHSFSKEFQKKKFKFLFCFTLFNLHEDRTINRYSIYSFFTGGQIYRPMKSSVQPVFQRTVVTSDVFFFYYENIVKEVRPRPSSQSFELARILKKF